MLTKNEKARHKKKSGNMIIGCRGFSDQLLLMFSIFSLILLYKISLKDHCRCDSQSIISSHSSDFGIRFGNFDCNYLFVYQFTTISDYT